MNLNFVRAVGLVLALPFVQAACGGDDPVGVEDGCPTQCTSGTVCISTLATCVSVCTEDAHCGAGQICEVNGVCAPEPEWLPNNDGNRTTVPAEGLTLRQADNPHILLYDLYVPPLATLTVEAGARVLIATGRSIIVDGNLVVDGVESAPVTFAAYEGTRWNGIQLGASAGSSSFRWVDISDGYLQVRGGLTTVEHNVFTDAWLNVAEMDSMTIANNEFFATVHDNAYTAITGVDINNLTIDNNLFTDIAGSGIYLRNFNEGEASVTVSTNRFDNIGATGIYLDARRSTSVGIAGNSLDRIGGSGVGIFGQGGTVGALEVSYQGNHITNAGATPVNISTDGSLSVDVRDLPSTEPTAVAGGDRTNRVAMSRGTAFYFFALDSEISVQQATIEDISGSGIYSGSRGSTTIPSALTVRDVTIDRVDGDGIGSSYGNTLNTELKNITISESLGTGLRIFTFEDIVSADIADIDVSDTEYSGIAIEGREGITSITLADDSANAAIQGISVQDTGGDGISINSRASIGSASVADYRGQRLEGRGLYIASRGSATVDIESTSISDTTSEGIRTHAWDLNTTRLNGTDSAPITVAGAWSWGVLIDAQYNVNAEVRYANLSDGNSTGLGIRQYQEDATGEPVRALVQNSTLENFHYSGIYVGSEATIQSQGDDDAVTIQNNRVGDVYDNGILVFARERVRDLRIEGNIVGDGDTTIGGCQVTDGYVVGATGVTLYSHRDRISASVVGNDICNTRGEGIAISAPIREPFAAGDSLPMSEVHNNRIVHANSRGLRIYTDGANLSGNWVAECGGGLLFRTENDVAQNIFINDDTYVRNEGTGVDLGPYAWAEITRVRSNENTGSGLAASTGSFIAIYGSQFMDNGGSGVTVGGAWENPGWSHVEQTCVGSNAAHGISATRELLLLAGVADAPKMPPEVVNSCVYNNGARGVSGLAHPHANAHNYATDVISSNVINNGEYGVIYAGDVQGSYVANNYTDGNVAANGGSCLTQGASRGADGSVYTYGTNREASSVGCVSGAVGSAITLGNTYDWGNSASATAPLGCLPDGESTRSYSPPAACQNL